MAVRGGGAGRGGVRAGGGEHGAGAARHYIVAELHCVEQILARAEQICSALGPLENLCIEFIEENLPDIIGTKKLSSRNITTAR